MADKSQLQEIRQRLKDDYAYYAPRALKIRTKAGVITPLTFNEAQDQLGKIVARQLAKLGRVRVIILKARQMGLSTWVGGRLYFRTSQNAGRKAIVVTHRADSTRALFDMTKRFHDQCPEALKMSTRYASRRELFFDKIDSGYMVATAGGDDIGRGETINYAHLSELAFWPIASALDNFSGLMDAVPNEDGSEVYIESTANGVSGIFYDQWQQAVQGKSDFIPVFLPWFIESGYRAEVPDNFERTPEESDLVAQFGLDNEQLMFRRRKIAEKGKELFQQEYPSTPEEAFLTTGRPIFRPDILSTDTKAARERFGQTAIETAGWEPLRRMALAGSSWEKNPRGELYVYRKLDPRETYYIGADVGAGVRRDWSVAQVMDSHRRQVAVYRAQVDPDYYATILYHLGMHYNEARIIVESNNHGLLTCTRLAKDLDYQNFYTEMVYDKITDTETIRLGFQTNVRTKSLIIDKLRAAHRDREIELNDYVTIEEMRSYIMTEDGKMEAEKGCHDDTVMSLALCNHINEGAFEPISNEADWYLEVG
jgi:hypothetical protein